MNPKNFIIPSLVIVIVVLSGILVWQTQTPTPQPEVSPKPLPTEPLPTEPLPTEPPPPEPPPSVNITRPKEGARVPHAVSLEGTVENLPENEELWIVKEIGSSYHPDRGPVSIVGNQWKGTAYVGNNQFGADKGNKFTILIVAASKETGKKYTEYLDNADEKGSYSGISSLWGGTPIKNITVIRDDSPAPTP